MSAWQGEGLPTRSTREAALFATAVHDIGWASVDAAPRIHADTGRPVDFMSAERAVRHEVWHRAIDILSAQSTYATALVAQHALSIYRRFRADPEWHAFFETLEAARDHWYDTDRRSDGSSGGAIDPPLSDRRTFLQDYTTVSLGDRLSLAFCMGWPQSDTAEGYDVTYDGDRLLVTPDPFAGARVDFQVPARRIENRPYSSDTDLHAALARSKPEMLNGVAQGHLS